MDSAVVWSAVTSAPGVTSERPMRPVMGAVMRGVAEIDAGGFEVRLLLGNRGGGLAVGRFGVVVVLLGDRVLLDERGIALGLEPGRHQIACALASAALALS